MDKCKVRMNSCSYWPGVSRQIEQMIQNCPVCLKFAAAKPKIKKKNMMRHKIPETQWCKLASDIFHFHGANFLVLVDYMTRFPIVKKLKGIDQCSIINIFEEICSERGYPNVLDNRLCYRGELFAKFLKRKGIKHVTSSPHYPQSNGLAEACVKVIKNLMHKGNLERWQIIQLCPICV